MLSNSRQSRSNWHYLTILTFYNNGKRLKYKGEKISPTDLSFLGAVLLENVRKNEFAALKAVRSILGAGFNLDRTIQRLLNLGLMERPAYGLYVVTNEGEYFLRDIETFFSRIIKNSARSKWRKIAKDELRAEYVRAPRIAGAELVANPLSIEMKFKRKIPDFRKSGKIRKGFESFVPPVPVPGL